MPRSQFASQSAALCTTSARCTPGSPTRSTTEPVRPLTTLRPGDAEVHELGARKRTGLMPPEMPFRTNAGGPWRSAQRCIKSVVSSGQAWRGHDCARRGLGAARYNDDCLAKLPCASRVGLRRRTRLCPPRFRPGRCSAHIAFPRTGDVACRKYLPLANRRPTAHFVVQAAYTTSGG